MKNSPESQKGEVNVQDSSSASPAFISGSPFTEESKLKNFLNSVGGYLLAFIVTTTLILLAVYLP